MSRLAVEAKEHPWLGGANGLSLDFDAQISYRGFRHVGIGLHFTYHLVFKSNDTCLSDSLFRGIPILFDAQSNVSMHPLEPKQILRFLCVTMYQKIHLCAKLQCGV
jgi:hypothetical protein